VAFQISTDSWLKALLLISAFGIGHCMVIVVAGSLTNLVQKYLNWADDSNAIIYIKRAAGVFVIFAGVYFIYITF
jgi:cytochrome c-type biogenesis protein